MWNENRIRRVLEEFEGRRSMPYKDTKGLWTIGIGRCLDKNPLSRDEYQHLLFGVNQYGSIDLDIDERDSRFLLRMDCARNLFTQPLSDEEIDWLFARDLEDNQQAAYDICRQKGLGPKVVGTARFEALISMCFQLGKSGVLGFRNMLTALANEDWRWAKREALDSKWAKKDTPRRARITADCILKGEWPDGIA